MNLDQARRLRERRGVKVVDRDIGAKVRTTYTPQFLGLEEGPIWVQQGGGGEGNNINAGEGLVIGFVDSGINPNHASFAYDPMHPFTSNISHFSGACQTGPKFPSYSCNQKIVSARYFSAGAQMAATLDPSIDLLSPFDAHGHGRYVYI